MQSNIVDNDDIIIVKLSAGLGNQMFQYAFAKAIEKTLKRKVLFDTSWFDEIKKQVKEGEKISSEGITYREMDINIFPNVTIESADVELSKSYIGDEVTYKSKMPGFIRNIFKLPKYISKSNKIYEKHYWTFDKKLFTPPKRAYYDGYFQHEKYVDIVKDEIKEDFTFPAIEESDEHNNYWKQRIQSCENPVFVHLRRGDYHDVALKMDYYEKAIKYVMKNIENPTFFIFGSDECEDFISSNFKNMNCNFEYVGYKNSLQKTDFRDMQLMSLCKHGIVANSSFSWWAAYLLSNENKLILAPTPWLHKESGIICKNFVRIKRKK